MDNKERRREQQREDREMIKEQAKAAIGENSRIHFQVDTIPSDTEGYDTKLVLWYVPRKGTDDGRDVSQDGGLPRIQRLKITEANELGRIAQNVADALPRLDVVLAGANKGRFTYHFIPAE